MLTNMEILRLPECKRLLQNWWDETASFARGVTSGVIADWLEERGFTDPIAPGHPTPLLPWLRADPAAGATIRVEPGYVCCIHEAAEVWCVSGSDAACGIFRTLVHEARNTLLRDGVRDEEPRFLMTRPETWYMIAMSPEMREYVQLTQFYANPLAANGTISTIFGYTVLLSTSVKNGHLIVGIGGKTLEHRVA